MFRINLNNNTRTAIRRNALIGAAAATTCFSMLAACPAGAFSGPAPRAASSLLNRFDSLNHRAPVSDEELQEMLARTQGLLRRYCQAPQDPKDPKSANAPDVTGLDAYGAMVKNLADLVDELIRDRPNGSETRREAAFKTLSVIYFAMLFGGISLPPSGALIGTGIGALAGAPVADLGGISIGAGTAIGFGTGIALSVGEVTLATMIIVSTSLQLNDRYPDNASVATGIRGFCGNQNAGPYESLLVNTIGMAFSDRVANLADQWDATPGLSAGQRALLRSIKSLQPVVKRCAEIKHDRRIAPNAPVAAPMSSWMQDVEKIVSPGTAGADEAWMRALGIGALSAKVQDGRLTVTLPPVLRTAGAPETVKSDLSQIRVKVGGNGGALDPYLKASVVPGDFDIHLGSATLIDRGADRDKIRVAFSVRRGSSLGHASLAFKWNGPEQFMTAFTPSLSQDATADAYFKVTDQGLSLDRIDLGPIQVGFSLPAGLPKDIPGVSNMIKAVCDSLDKGVKEMLRDAMGIGPALEAVKACEITSVKSALNADPTAYGVSHVSAVEALSVHNGKLQAKVRATALNFPGAVPNGRAVVAAYQSMLASGRRTLTPGRGIGTGIGAGVRTQIERRNHPEL